ncbi:MAG: hypothetical protein ACE5LU_18715 [Anaerolineae bacterium]
MKQQVLEAPVPRVADAPPNGKPANVLVQLWDEAEQAVVARRRPRPAPRQMTQAAPARVRYAYD